MALRNILIEGDPQLRKKCREVTDFSDKTAALMDDLRETLIDANGLGLAAPQVGILRRAVVIVRDDEIVELINPNIVEKSGEVTLEEACLSCPGVSGEVTRPRKVTVEAYDRHGEKFSIECTDMAARAACHELDHLDGTLFIDIASVLHYEDEEDGEE